eukprot:GHUV01033113.1.p2 GENE.GHUV01033113.1~~GHUV01033113.1.p2  ORF type:complete len:103 (+),score=10.67 GHUV01033113.1:143-451(+)
MVTTALISSATNFLRFAAGQSQFAAAVANSSVRAFSASAGSWSESPLKAALSAKIPKEQVNCNSRKGSTRLYGLITPCRHPVLTPCRILVCARRPIGASESS